MNRPSSNEDNHLALDSFLTIFHFQTQVSFFFLFTLQTLFLNHHCYSLFYDRFNIWLLLVRVRVRLHILSYSVCDLWIVDWIVFFIFLLWSAMSVSINGRGFCTDSNKIDEPFKVEEAETVPPPPTEKVLSIFRFCCCWCVCVCVYGFTNLEIMYMCFECCWSCLCWEAMDLLDHMFVEKP